MSHDLIACRTTFDTNNIKTSMSPQTLTGPLKHLNQSVCWRFAAVLGIIALLHDLIKARLQVSDRWPHI